MRTSLLILTFILAASVPAGAEVTVNPGALDAPVQAAPPSSSQAQPSPAPGPAKPARPKRKAPAKKDTAPTTAKPAAPASQEPVAKGPAATGIVVPQAAPPPAELPPALPNEAAHPPAKVVPPPVVAGAAGEATPIASGVRVTFAPGSADLNPATQAALQRLAHQSATDGEARFTILAAAAGAADDPSTPRRLALARGLAARGVLLEQGIPSPHIYVRVLPPGEPGAASDRVDVTVATANAAAPTTIAPTTIAPTGATAVPTPSSTPPASTPSQ